MKLLIKQRVFSWSDTYDIYDESGNGRYFVEAKLLSLGHQLHVYDVNGNEIGMIKQKVLTFLPAFDIYVVAECVAAFKRNFLLSILNMKLILMAGEWKVIFLAGIMMYIQHVVQ